MAHNITDNMIAYKNETPWHGLGFRVDPNMNGAEMLKVAGLDWKVQRRALAMRDAQGEGLIVDPLKEWKAIVRADNNTVFGIPTARYQIVQNQEIVDLFREYCEAGHAKMDVVGALRGGAVVWALAKLNGGTEATLKGGDVMKGYVLFCTSHDGTLSTIGKATSVRVVCNNTLTAALTGGADFKVKHSTKWTAERAKEAKEKLGIATENIQILHETASKLSNVTIDRKGQIEFVSRLMDGKCLLDQVIDNSQPAIAVQGDSLLDAAIANTIQGEPEDKLNRVGKAILEAMMDAPGADLESAKGTLWGAVNGVSYYTDHLAGRTQDSRLSNAWFGVNDLLKRSAMTTALEMAGIKR